ncbi:MAG: NADH-quinone oxidoreductase subunit NuoH [Deltaproteobacteria bacterium CG23_combo_of_CG06-09_8_20_14_all_60_8]|nr:MAG: NADH-quinone oxidoreductase subunit H [Desulfobacterales bacterium CG2_30_60_27]PIP44347.1 MAG: NADH-quinone oxidoreductase subunit NuoH [Deltaproteobacteria bacterium CG23_combo_of_CG06-09_8_20_14_all_60_8]
MNPPSEPIRLLAFLIGLIIFAALNAAYLVWLERKVAGHVQRRIGPKEVGPFGLLQPLVDGIKLMTKQILVPDHIDPILFRIAPPLLLIPAVMSFVTIPFSETLVARDINLGLLMIFAFASINVLGILLGGWGSNNKYAVIAAARGVSQNVAYEIPMLITVITMVMITHTLNLNEIVRQQAGGIFNWYIFRWSANPLMLVSFLIFFTCSMAETNRAPFDLGEAESELVAGYHTEYSGMGFGLFFMGEYANIVIGCSLATLLFLGGWQCPFGLWPGVHWFLIKLYLLIFTVILIRWTFPRTTIYGLLNLSWKILIPFALFNLILTGAMLKIWPLIFP